jgi:uncharacterized protein with FMN-binding domain
MEDLPAMLNAAKKRESLAGKLLLSSALVALSLAYGWWQRPPANSPRLAMAPAPLPPANRKPVPAPPAPAVMAPAPATQVQPVAPEAATGSGTTDALDRTAAEPPKPSTVAKATPQAVAPALAPSAPEAPPQQNKEISPPSPPLAAPAPQALPAILPVDGSPAPPFLVTGAPGPGAKSPVPAGSHLEDGDYVSSRHEFMWGDLRIKIFVRGGQIAGLQAVQYPDHRAQSLYLSELALPALESEVIKNQTSQVDTVSSATDTSYVFQDAVADAIVKATRGE